MQHLSTWSAIRLSALLFTIVLSVGVATQLLAVDYVAFEYDGKSQKLAGQVLTEGAEGGVVFETRDGSRWVIPGDLVTERTSDAIEFCPMSDDELSAYVLSTLPPGFKVRETKHYLIFYNTSMPYAQWTGSLFERLYAGFANYWKTKRVKLQEPDRPMVAVIFASRAGYKRWSADVLGEAADNVLAYYNLRSNQLVLWDQTGAGSQARSRGTTSEINRILSQPGASSTVATIVHEATHQIAFNSGMNQRLGATPLWLLEGMALYFETPDLSSSRGWGGIGSVNYPRLARFRQYFQARRQSNSLVTLITDDSRLQDTSTGLDAYAESWALLYFMIHRYPRELVEYLEIQSKKQPGLVDTPEERWEDFRKTFGNDVERLDSEFVRYIMSLR